MSATICMSKSNQAFVDKMYALLQKREQQFGRGGFYQSLPLLNIPGQRPTDQRIAEYQLDSILNETTSVLDVGCNCGFFALSVASGVRSVTGVEINPGLVEVARCTQEYLGITNAQFIPSSFEAWNAQGRQWDVVFAFAVHLWVRMPFELFALKLLSLVRYGGILVIESHNIHKNDGNFDQRVKFLLGCGMRLRRWGNIQDDGIHERIYAILKREGCE